MRTTHMWQMLCYDKLKKGSCDVCMIIGKVSIILV